MKKIRIWQTRSPRERRAYTREVRTIEEGESLLEILSEYEIQQSDEAGCTVEQGIEEFDETSGKWVRLRLRSKLKSLSKKEQEDV